VNLDSKSAKIFFGLCLLGIAVRIYLYIFNRTLWLDEAYLANAISLAGWRSILTEPLGNNQAAPLAFVILVKLSTALIGLSDWVLRLWPFLFGVASVWVAERLGALLFKQQSSKWFFVAVISLSPSLIYYSTEFKQYSIDVFFTLLLTYAALRVIGEREKSFLHLSIVAGVAVWFSYPSIIIITASYISIFLAMVFKLRSRSIWEFLYSSAVVAISFLLIYIISIKGSSSNGNLINFWHDAYAPLPLSLESMKWYATNFLGLTHLSLFHLGIAGHLPMEEWKNNVNKLALFFFMGSFVILYRKNKVIFIYFVTVLFLALLLSMFKVYPFRSRLILYLVPLVFLAYAFIFDFILSGLSKESWGVYRKTGFLLGLAMILNGVYLAGIKLFEPYNYSDSKTLIKNMIKIAPDAPVVLSTWSNHAFDFYKRSYGLTGLKPVAYIQTRNAEKDRGSIYKLICESTDPKIWILFSHRYNEQMPIVEGLKSDFTLDNEITSYGAGAFLLIKNIDTVCNK